MSNTYGADEETFYIPRVSGVPKKKDPLPEDPAEFVATLAAHIENYIFDLLQPACDCTEVPSDDRITEISRTIVEMVFSVDNTLAGDFASFLNDFDQMVFDNRKLRAQVEQLKHDKRRDAFASRTYDQLKQPPPEPKPRKAKGTGSDYNVYYKNEKGYTIQ